MYSIKTGIFSQIFIKDIKGRYILVRKKHEFEVGKPLTIYKRIQISKGDFVYVGREVCAFESGVYRLKLERPSMYRLAQKLLIIWLTCIILSVIFASAFFFFLWFIFTVVWAIVLVLIDVKRKKILKDFKMELIKVQ